jgi:hypothetical protein
LPKDKQAKGSSYLKYSGLAIQIALTILLFGYLGHYIDGKQENAKPIWTLILSVFGLIGNMVYLVKKVANDK